MAAHRKRMTADKTIAATRKAATGANAINDKGMATATILVTDMYLPTKPEIPAKLPRG